MQITISKYSKPLIEYTKKELVYITQNNHTNKKAIILTRKNLDGKIIIGYGTIQERIKTKKIAPGLFKEFKSYYLYIPKKFIEKKLPLYIEPSEEGELILEIPERTEE